MQVLIVEDNSFNAFCLSRLITGICKFAKITVVTNGCKALQYLEEANPDLIILDGDLGANDAQTTGPMLAGQLFKKFPHKPIIAWTDCESMRHAFAKVFDQHSKSFNEFNSWPKLISKDKIEATLNYLGKNSHLHHHLFRKYSERLQA